MAARELSVGMRIPSRVTQSVTTLRVALGGESPPQTQGIDMTAG
jgi:hypothetical protein